MEVVVRFLLVGGLNTLISYGVYCLLVFFCFNYILAATLGYIVAMLNSFILNKFWTFSCKGNIHSLQIVGFIVINLISLSVNLVFLEIFICLGIDKYISQIFAIGFSLVVNFLGCKVFVFKN